MARVDRREFLTGAGSALAGLTWVVLPRAAASDPHPAIAYMRGVAADLFAAQRSGTAAAFLGAIDRHADVEAIALYGLGRYQSELRGSEKRRFYRGVAAFMARYFADQLRRYQVAKADIGSATPTGNNEVMVRTTVTLTSGAAYNVVWYLAQAGGRFKVRDVKVLGFSLSFLQRAIFQSYIAQNGGDVRALVSALTR